MGVDNIGVLKNPAGGISDIKNFINKRQRRGKTTKETIVDIVAEGYDIFAAQAFVLQYWEIPENGEVES